MPEERFSSTAPSSLKSIKIASSISINEQKIESYTIPASTNDFVTDSWNRQDSKRRNKTQTWPCTYREIMLECEQTSTSSSSLAVFNVYSIERWIMEPSNEPPTIYYTSNDYHYTFTGRNTELINNVGASSKLIQYDLSTDTAFAGSWVNDYDCTFGIYDLTTSYPKNLENLGHENMLHGYRRQDAVAPA